MFERRARGVLIVLILGCLALLARAAQVQLVENDQWQTAADEAMTRTLLTEASRGRLLDRHGRVMAHDVPCNDAAVAYWFVSDPPDEARLKLLARDLARQTAGYYKADTAEQIRRVEAMLPEARRQVDQFWNRLAIIADVSSNDLAVRRRTILDRVEARRRDVVLRRYQRAKAHHEAEDLSPWWRRFLLGEGEAPPELSDYEEPIADEEQAHVVLRDLSNETYNELLKLQSDLPPTLSNALRLRASRTRSYPAGRAAAHVVGRVGEVNAEDLEVDPELDDELRRYLPGDLNGRVGLEAVAERQLRGTRGRIDRDLAADTRAVAVDAAGGSDVTTTIDLELSNDIRDAFQKVDFRWPDKSIETGPAHGAAVVIDVESGGILSMVSLPDFDPNQYVELADKLYADQINRPAVNRATMTSIVPGSTVKPVVGLGAIQDGFIGPHDTIQCDGYLHVHVGGVLQTYTNTARCWTASMMGQHAHLQGHQLPTSDLHPTPSLHETPPEPGHLTFADALQRSCNIYFETLGHRAGTEKLASWLERFGLGSRLDLGLPEREGLLPTEIPDRVLKQDAMAKTRYTWFGSIGQGYVQATPVQMANVAATLARGGVRLKPKLLLDETNEPVDLGIDPETKRVLRAGMVAAVETEAGSGSGIRDRLPMKIAGKTGSAQADLLTVTRFDENGLPARGDDGRILYDRITAVGSQGRPNPQIPWYRRTNEPTEPRIQVTHSWFIGYAPADDPKVAFAVFVEYGGSGGVAAGSVAAQVVQALVKHEYLEATRTPDPSRPGHYLVP
jgi:penicillin-binding protein 2